LSRRFGTANTITVLRIVLIPVFVVALLAPWPEWFFNLSPASLGEKSHLASVYKPWVAAVIYAILALTDSLDGYIARKRSEVTTFGKFVDPLADKLLVAAALLALIELGDLPSWVALIIISRDSIVSGLRMLAATRGEVMAAAGLGKLKTVVTIVAILLFIVKRSALLTSLDAGTYSIIYASSWLVMALALTLTVVSMMVYVRRCAHLFRERDGGGRDGDGRDGGGRDDAG
jgi:CDP-diacylglycerol--glycerol-3-phosphate 3-phosphatidyltransferase